jgi:hypothetical protein
MNEKGPVRGPVLRLVTSDYSEPPIRGRISFCTYFTPTMPLATLPARHACPTVLVHPESLTTASFASTPILPEMFGLLASLSITWAWIASDPYGGFRLDSGAKRIVTFVVKPPRADLILPIERDGARILRFQGGVAFSCYERIPKGPVFMTLLEKAFGKDQTTRTWHTLEKVVSA